MDESNINIIPLNTLDSNIKKSLDFNPNKAEIYNKFILLFVGYILQTYMGDEYYNENDINNHIEWCWNKSLLDIKNNDIVKIKKDGEHKKYFKNHLYSVFYNIKNKNISLESKIYSYWSNLLDYKNIKSNKKLIEYGKIYKLIDDNSK